MLQQVYRYITAIERTLGEANWAPAEIRQFESNSQMRGEYP